MDKKQYSVDDLLLYTYKYNKISCVLFAKDTDCRYVYVSNVEDAVNSGEDHTILGKTDMDIQYDPELGKMFYEQDKEIIRTGEPIHCYCEFYVHGKKEVREISKNPIYHDGKIIGVSGVVNDVTELMRLKEQFENLSILDKSTGCYNRNYFLKNDYNKEENLPCAYIMCDCNELKFVNDKYGHEEGDRYILLISDILRLVVDKIGICIRWGGDEFLLVVPNCDEQACKQLINRIEYEQELKRKIFPRLNAAMGYCIRTTTEQSEEEVIKAADQAMYRDKAERKMSNMEIKEEYKSYMREIVRSLPATLFFKDTEGKYVFTTKVCDLINAGPEGTIIGKWDFDIQFDKALGQRYYEEDMRILETGESTHTIDEIDNGSGDVAYIEVLKQPICNDDGEVVGICGVCNDVTELEKLRRQYEKLSLYDSLTGAYNRNYSIDYKFDREDCLPCSYIFCDCNNLKKINDNFGHDMGDKYILEAFKILRDNKDEKSVVIRWGGDEFLVITPNCDEEAHNALLGQIIVAQRKLSDIKPGMGMAVGGTVRTTMEISESEVMKTADEKMYENKKTVLK